MIIAGKCESGQGNKGVAAPTAKPGIACNDLGFFVDPDEKFFGSIVQTVFVAVAWDALLNL